VDLVSESVKAPKEYLREPYSRVLTPDEETGTYTAEIREFPGCVAQGDTPEEAFKNLEAAAGSWIEVALAMGQTIPEPAQEESYSGRIVLRLPKSLHRRAAQAAERDGTSLNQFLVAAVAEQLGAVGIGTLIAERSEQRVEAAQMFERKMRASVGLGNVAAMGAAGARDTPLVFGSLMAGYMPPSQSSNRALPRVEEPVESLLKSHTRTLQQKVS
jgi:predicted RNase H-like HicB family nuclease